MPYTSNQTRTANGVSASSPRAFSSIHTASRQPHAHSGKPGDDLVALPGLSFDRALAVVEMHLRQRGEIHFQRLLEELKS